MIIMAIQSKDTVKSITVVEKYKEVIDLVASQLPFNDKVRIINADVFEWKPERGQCYLCLYGYMELDQFRCLPRRNEAVKKEIRALFETHYRQSEKI